MIIILFNDFIYNPSHYYPINWFCFPPSRRPAPAPAAPCPRRAARGRGRTANGAAPRRMGCIGRGANGAFRVGGVWGRGAALRAPRPRSRPLFSSSPRGERGDPCGLWVFLLPRGAGASSQQGSTCPVYPVSPLLMSPSLRVPTRGATPGSPGGLPAFEGCALNSRLPTFRGKGQGLAPQAKRRGGGGVLTYVFCWLHSRSGGSPWDPLPVPIPPRDSVFPPLGRSGAGRGRRAGPLPPGALPRRPAASCRRNARRYAPVSSSGSPSLAGAERRIYHPVAAVHLPCSFVTAYEGKLSVGNSPLLRSRLRRGSSHLEEASLPRRTPHAGRELRRASRRCYAPLPPPGAPGASSFPPPPFLRLRRLRAPRDEPPRHPAAGPEGLCLPGSGDPPSFPGRPPPPPLHVHRAGDAP